MNSDSLPPHIRSAYTVSQTPKRWYKRWYTWAILIVVILLLWWAFQFLSAYNTIVVDDGRDDGFWGDVKGLFGGDGGSNYVDPYPMPDKNDGRYDILILGLRGDDDTYEDGRWLTDTMLVVSVDRPTGRAAMVSIPRDLYIDLAVPEYEKDYHVRGKINEVYIDGLSHNGKGLGLAETVVSKITGVYIDNSVVFDFTAFKEIVDTLGGIDIYLSKPFTERNQFGFEFSLPAGDNHLDGEKALYYVRSRFSTSDFDRGRRQQQVIAAIKSKALSLGFLANPVNITGLLSDLKGNVRTDIQLWEIDNLIDTAQHISEKNIEQYVMTTENVLYETHADNGAYILLPKTGQFKIVQNLFHDLLYPEEKTATEE